MKCSQCCGKTKVLCVRIDHKQTTHRRKQCVECGYVFYTKEYEVVLGDEFHKVDNFYHRAVRTKVT